MNKKGDTQAVVALMGILGALAIGVLLFMLINKTTQENPNIAFEKDVLECSQQVKYVTLVDKNVVAAVSNLQEACIPRTRDVSQESPDNAAKALLDELAKCTYAFGEGKNENIHRVFGDNDPTPCAYIIYNPNDAKNISSSYYYLRQKEKIKQLSLIEDITYSSFFERVIENNKKVGAQGRFYVAADIGLDCDDDYCKKFNIPYILTKKPDCNTIKIYFIDRTLSAYILAECV